MLRRLRPRLYLNKFVPSSIDSLPEFPGVESDRSQLGREGHLEPQLQPLSAQPEKLKVKTYRPLSPAARQHLADVSEDKVYHRVTPEWFGLRLDEFLMQHYGGQWEFPTILKLVQQGHIYRYRSNGKKIYTRVTDRLELDELVVVPTFAHWQHQLAPPTGVIPDPTPEKREIPLSGKLREEAMSWVLFKNEYVICINKPSGIPIQGGKDIGLNIEDMLSAWKYTNAYKPLVCNHLDRETSGVVVLARNKEAFRMLGRMFTRRVVPNNVYWAFCVGRPRAKVGRLRMHFEVEKVDGGEQIIARPTPTPTTRVGIAEFVANYNLGDFASFLSFYPLTSRKHQLRIMAAHALRCPIIGDARYAGEAANPRSLRTFWNPKGNPLPLHLHHRKIQLPYKNAKGQFICVTAPVPKHMKETFDKFGIPSESDDPLVPG